MVEKSDWLAHGDDLLVDSLHDVLEGRASVAPVAMVPPRPPSARSGFGAIVGVGVLLGLVIGVSMRLVCAAPAAPPAIAARLSAPLLAHVEALEEERIADSATGGPADDEDAELSEDEESKPKPKRRARRRWHDGTPEDIYAPYDALDGVS
jgi:hypothetical protein